MEKITELTLTTDGASSNNQYENKREAAVGYVIQQGTETLVKDGESLGKGPEFTNNVAEYKAIKLGAERVSESWDAKTVRLNIQSDSELVVKQLTGEYSRNDEKMQRNYDEVTDTLSAFLQWEVTHVSETADNAVSVADDLAGDALEN